jgi:phosphoglycerate kinase
MLSKKIGLDKITSFLKNSRVLVRADFNVPIKDGKIKDKTRIESTIPTIKKILESGAKNVVLMSHLGRPDGHKKPEYSLQAIVPTLEQLIGTKVCFVNDCVGKEAEEACASISNGGIVLLENLRFHPEEEGSSIGADGKKVKADKANVKKFQEQLTKLGDIYVNDAFGTAHRAHSSITGINVPIRAAGYLMKKELDFFAKALEHPEKPFLVILGGAKVKDKIQLIMNMMDRVDEMIIGGAMAFTFLKRIHNMEIGNSLFDEEGFKSVDDILKKAKEKNVKLHFPVDFISSDKKEGGDIKLNDISSGIEKGWLGLDVGEKTIKNNADVIKRAKTVVWNGPQGLFEVEAFKKGSVQMLHDLIKATEKGATTIVGGGDTVSLVHTVKGADSKLSHVSTGGGASLELLEGKKLPGVEYLTNIDDLNNMKMKA